MAPTSAPEDEFSFSYITRTTTSRGTTTTSKAVREARLAVRFRFFSYAYARTFLEAGVCHTHRPLLTLGRRGRCVPADGRCRGGTILADSQALALRSMAGRPYVEQFPIAASRRRLSQKLTDMVRYRAIDQCGLPWYRPRLLQLRHLLRSLLRQPKVCFSRGGW